MKSNFTKFILIVVVLGVIIFLITYIYSNRTNIDKKLNNQNITKSEKLEVKPDIAKSPINLADKYSYLFEEERGNMTSNVVGYFANGAFVWYVPDWLIQNWSISNNDKEKINISPKVNNKPREFSDIVFTIGSSTETFNAQNLYTEKIAVVDPKDLIINEVVLNKHAGDVIKLLIETNTRIYHVQESLGDQIKDFYYMDGNGKTLVITFEASASIFNVFSSKIRNLVEGIGEAKGIQG